MTYAVFAVIFGSIIYYAIVFISEVFGYTPKCIQRMCTSKKLRHAIKEKDGLGDLKVQNMTANPLSTLQLEKMAKEETNLEPVKTKSSWSYRLCRRARRRVARTIS